MSRRNTLLMLALLALLMPALACGASTVATEKIPIATLPPDTPAFMVASLTTDGVQMVAGKTGKTLWKREFPHADQVAGLLSGGMLYRGASAYPVLTALRPGDGAVLWQFRACGSADTTLTLAGGLIYLTCLSDPSVPPPVATPTIDPQLYATPTMSLTPWATPTMSLTPYATPTYGPPPRATPTFSPPQIIQQYINDTLYALDARTGRVRWQAFGRHFRALDGSLVIAQTTNGLEALRADSGRPLWTRPMIIRQQTQGEPPFSFSVAAAAGVIAYSPDGAHVEAVRESDGHLLWRGVIPQQGLDGAWDWTVEAVMPAGAVVHGERGVVVFDSATGSIRWQRIVAITSPLVTVAPGADGRTIYMGYTVIQSGNIIQQLSAVDAGSGATRWRYTGKFYSQARFGLRFSDAVVYVAGSNDMDAVGASDGVNRWRDKLIDPILSFSSNAAVICIGTGRNLYLLNASDGKEVWKEPLGPPQVTQFSLAVIII